MRTLLGTQSLEFAFCNQGLHSFASKRTLVHLAANGCYEPELCIQNLCRVRSRRENCCAYVNFNVSERLENRSSMQSAARHDKRTHRLRTKQPWAAAAIADAASVNRRAIRDLIRGVNGGHCVWCFAALWRVCLSYSERVPKLMLSLWRTETDYQWTQEVAA